MEKQESDAEKAALLAEFAQSTELVVPGIGQLVNLEDPREVALAIDAIRDLEYQLREAKTDLTRAIVYHSQKEGSKTLHYDGVEVQLRGGSVTEYDETAIYTELIEAGMSEERAAQIVKHTVTLKVDAREADRAGKANTVYMEIIERNKTVKDTPFSASVKRA